MEVLDGKKYEEELKEKKTESEAWIECCFLFKGSEFCLACGSRGFDDETLEAFKNMINKEIVHKFLNDKNIAAFELKD